ncbi:helix-turn-helix domain-containing protein [Streptomyces sp. NPDC005438]|uniref:helix-turn-helix domain-containing protein n=1 Tax=Streptomyces sp. NPDC005438 TaxID=3156880 RepID=UPI0033AEC58A
MAEKDSRTSQELLPEVRQWCGELERVKSTHKLSLAALAEGTGYSRTSWSRSLKGLTLPPREAVEALGAKLDPREPALLEAWEAAQRTRADKAPKARSGKAATAEKVPTPAPAEVSGEPHEAVEADQKGNTTASTEAADRAEATGEVTAPATSSESAEDGSREEAPASEALPRVPAARRLDDGPSAGTGSDDASPEASDRRPEEDGARAEASPTGAEPEETEGGGDAPIDVNALFGGPRTPRTPEGTATGEGTRSVTATVSSPAATPSVPKPKKETPAGSTTEANRARTESGAKAEPGSEAEPGFKAVSETAPEAAPEAKPETAPAKEAASEAAADGTAEKAKDTEPTATAARRPDRAAGARDPRLWVLVGAAVVVLVVCFAYL